MKGFILLLSFTVGIQAFAGFETGNGGDVVVCEGESSVETLDIYEARVIRGHQL